jgi:mono/diheme cytochrome c family protein
MRISTAVSVLAGATALCGAAAIVGHAQAPQATDVPTFTRDVAPVLYANCVGCHRPGEIAPMSLLTYAEVRPWAQAISRRVADGSMPPWHADAPLDTFANERRLTPPQKDIIARWVTGGAPQGDPALMPARPTFAEGWQIGQPDAVFEMTEDYAVPARGEIQYENFYIPTNFTEAKWVQAVEARPGNRTLVHHILVYYEAPLEGTRPAPILLPNREDNRLPSRPEGNRPLRQPLGPPQLLGTYAPGTNPQTFPLGTAVRLAPGGVLRLQMHYTANGTAGTDRSKVALIFAKQPPATEMRVSQFLNARLAIPPGAANEAVSTDVAFAQDATVWGLFPHTHVRGKRWSYVLMMPDGTSTPILSVPKYDFNWQLYYMFTKPLQVPKGARIVSTAWYDNSTANRFNPDPSLEVHWGDQTWEEMQYTGILYSARTQTP